VSAEPRIEVSGDPSTAVAERIVQAAADGQHDVLPEIGRAHV